MNLCSDGHDEVCHEGNQCPVCDKVAEITTLNDEVSQLKADIRQLERDQE